MILRFFDSISAHAVNLNPKLWVLGLAVLSSPLYAEEATVVKEVNPLTGVASLSLRSSTASSSEYDYRLFVRPAVNLQYEIKDVVTFGLFARASKDLNNEQRSSMTDLAVSASHSFAPTDAFGIGVDVSYGAPVDKELYRYSNAKGTLGASVSLSYKFDGSLTGLSVNGGLTYERYLYSYEYADGGAILTKQGLSQSIGASYEWKEWTGSVSLSNVTAWDFDGEQENDSFLAVETIQYKITDEWSASIAHINDGNTYDYLGAANNVKFYDKRRSQIALGVSYKF